MTDKDKKALAKLLKQAQAALLDPKPDEGGKLTKALDKAIAKLESA